MSLSVYNKIIPYRSHPMTCTILGGLMLALGFAVMACAWVLAWRFEREAKKMRDGHD